jgi:hypothetical protein
MQRPALVLVVLQDDSTARRQLLVDGGALTQVHLQQLDLVLLEVYDCLYR